MEVSSVGTVQYQTISSDPGELLSVCLTRSLSNPIKISRANHCCAVHFGRTEQDWGCAARNCNTYCPRPLFIAISVGLAWALILGCEKGKGKAQLAFLSWSRSHKRPR